MSGVNKVILVGRLGRDPELRATTSGAQVANMRIATSERWRDKETGQQEERTEWHGVVAFGRLADICGQYLSKGAQVYIEGRLQTRKWQDKDGAERSVTEIVASEMQMLGGRDAGESRASHGEPPVLHRGGSPAPLKAGEEIRVLSGYQDQRPAERQAPAPSATAEQYRNRRTRPAPPVTGEHLDDEIPF